MAEDATERQGALGYPGLDVVKFLMALLVIEIHTNPFFVGGPGLATDIVRGVDCLAVPFFFIASGFLCFRKVSLNEFCSPDSPSSIRVRETIFRQLRMYLAWTILYLPITAWADVVAGNSAQKSMLLFVRGTLLIGENQYSWPLWYLLASVVAFGLIYGLLRSGISPMRVLLFSVVMLFAGFGLGLLRDWNSVSSALKAPVGLYFKVFGSVRNGLFEGFFYVSVGTVLGIWEQNLQRIPIGVPVVGMAVALAGCIFITYDAHLPFCVLLGLSAFLLCIRRQSPSSPVQSFMRLASIVMYLVHMMFAVFFAYVICGSTDPDLIMTPTVDHAAMWAFSDSSSLRVDSTSLR